MSAHVLLNFSTSWEKEMKCEAHIELNTFNTEAQLLLDAIYPMTVEIFCKCDFCVKK